MTTVTVIDSIMGSGKTSYVIDMMNKSDESKKFIYVTPFLNEVDRVKDSVKNRVFQSPDEKNSRGRKFDSLKKLIRNGENIVTTHALFAKADQELLELLEWEDYTLIIDEVMDVINKIDLTKDDYQILLKSGQIKIANTKQVQWIGANDFDSRFNDIKCYAQSDNLFSVNNIALVWNFPARIFKAFDEVYILTYMFDGQLQKYYYDLHNIEYEYYSVSNSQLIPYVQDHRERNHLKELITIYDGNLNDIGERKTALSKSWYDKNPSKRKQLKANLYNYFQNIAKAKVDQILWTTFKDYEANLKGKGYSKSFVVWNKRATNEYKERTVLAYCLNRYLNPIEEQFFHGYDLSINQDLLALSDLLQWIFRSAIREGKPISIYIPSKRMRTLLKRWLDGEI